MQGIATLVVGQPCRDRVEHAIEDLDATIRETRAVDFGGSPGASTGNRVSPGWQLSDAARARLVYG
jgi:hypothetical protein